MSNKRRCSSQCFRASNGMFELKVLLSNLGNKYCNENANCVLNGVELTVYCANNFDKFKRANIYLSPSCVTISVLVSTFTYLHSQGITN